MGSNKKELKGPLVFEETLRVDLNRGQPHELQCSTSSAFLNFLQAGGGGCGFGEEGQEGQDLLVLGYSHLSRFLPFRLISTIVLSRTCRGSLVWGVLAKRSVQNA